MFYSPEVIEDIRLGNDIMDVVSAYVQLKQHGAYYFGLCPFHAEKSPSFSVSVDRQTFYCFGCGATGNIYSFLMRKENFSFPDAVQFLAERIHYRLPEAGGAAETHKNARIKEGLYEVNKLAARFFYDALQEPEGAEAVRYLDMRGITRKCRVKHGLGYAPLKRGALHKYLTGAGAAEDVLEVSGLFTPDKLRAGWNDKFYGRLMFPILDVRGRVVGFGGRVLDAGPGGDAARSVPKYMNSPETPVFEKSRNLYGIQNARQAKSKEIILVEGYMDVISLYQGGFQNTVAALGTAFNAQHAGVLRRYAESAVILFDSDEAGTKAALRAIPVLTAAGLRVKVLQVRDAKDPDEYIKRFGSESFGKLLGGAQHHILFQVEDLKRRYDLTDMEGKIRFTTEAAKLLAQAESPVERDVYARAAAEASGVAFDAIMAETEKLRGMSLPNAGMEKKLNFTRPAYPSVRPEHNKLKEKGLLEAKKLILNLMASDTKLLRKINQYVSAEEMGDEVYAKLYNLLVSFAEKGRSAEPAELISHFETVVEQEKAGEVFAQGGAGDRRIAADENTERVLNDAMKKVKIAYLDGKIRTETDAEAIKKLLESKRAVY